MAYVRRNIRKAQNNALSALACLLAMYPDSEGGSESIMPNLIKLEPLHSPFRNNKLICVKVVPESL